MRKIIHYYCKSDKEFYKVTKGLPKVYVECENITTKQKGFKLKAYENKRNITTIYHSPIKCHERKNPELD